MKAVGPFATRSLFLFAILCALGCSGQSKKPAQSNTAIENVSRDEETSAKQSSPGIADSSTIQAAKESNPEIRQQSGSPSQSAPDSKAVAPSTAPKIKVAFTRDVCSKIEEDMTRTKVESILGCSRGDYTTGPWKYGEGAPGYGISGNYSSIDKWIDDVGEIVIGFYRLDGPDEFVMWAHYSPIVRR